MKRWIRIGCWVFTGITGAYFAARFSWLTIEMIGSWLGWCAWPSIGRYLLFLAVIAGASSGISQVNDALVGLQPAPPKDDPFVEEALAEWGCASSVRRPVA